MTIDWTLLLRLLVAHWLADFILQTESKANGKTTKKWHSLWLYVHGAIAGILGYLFAGYWSAWWLFPLLAFTHIAIDLWKSSRKDSTISFAIDQLLHLIVLCIVWLLLSNNWKELLCAIAGLFSQRNTWILLAAYLTILWPTGQLIAKVLEPWQRPLIDTQTSFKNLEKAGFWIGCLERLITLTSILLMEYQVIGFFIAAKSVFFFQETSKEKGQIARAYFVIGTFLSFTIAIAIGLLAKWILQ